MVWARTKLVIWEYIFEPVKELRISYAGPHPEKMYAKLKELIRLVFNVPDAYVQEKVYSWERGKESEKFEVEWEINKILDTYSYISVELSVRGFSAAGEGKAEITIKPRLLTEYPQDTIWQQSIIYEMLRRFWDSRFYHHRRMEYVNMGKEMIVTFETDIKKYFEKLRAGAAAQEQKPAAA
jgi:hypothetical protein